MILDMECRNSYSAKEEVQKQKNRRYYALSGRRSRFEDLPMVLSTSQKASWHYHHCAMVLSPKMI